MIYIWKTNRKTKKRLSKVHIEGPDKKSVCSVENAGVVFENRNTVYPLERDVCRICTRMSQKPKRKKRKAKRHPKKPKSFFKTEKWARLKYEALRMNDGRCNCCGRGVIDGVVLHVDHIKPVSKYPELIDQLGNLQVLCASCNWGKGARYEDDWRDPDLAKLMGEKL